MRRFPLLLLLLSLSVFAQEQKVSIPVGGGLNTRSSDFDIKQNECRQAINVDFSRNLNAISKRLGYGTVASLSSGYDSLTGLYGAYFSDATKRLAFSADSAGVGYGGVYVTNEASGRIDSATRLTTYWNTQYPTNFAMFDDKLYAVNGVQKGIVWDGETVRSFPIAASGEPKIVPIGPYTGKYRLNGEYRYTVRATVYDGDSIRTGLNGYVASPIKVSGGRVLLTEFGVPANDSTLSSIDSTRLRIYRTKANPGRLDDADSAYILPFVVKSSGTSFAGVVVIDSIPDSILSDTAIKLIDKSMVGRDTMGVFSYKYGAPSYLSSTYLYYNTTNDTSEHNGGIYHGLASTLRLKSPGLRYVATIYDTLNHIESDTSASCFVGNSSAKVDTLLRTVRIGLPKIPDSVKGAVINLYRAYVIPIGRDSGVLVKTYTGTGSLVDLNKVVEKYNKELGWDAYYWTTDQNNSFKKYLYMRGLASDTIMTTPFFFLKSISSDSTAYTDSTRYDSLMARSIYRGNTPPHLLNNIFAYGGRMFGTMGSRLYWSMTDSAQFWGAFDNVAVNPDDGDEGVAAWPERLGIRYMKNGSSYNVYQGTDLQWSYSEVTDKIGCIAPRSHLSGMGGNYYLSNHGFVLESEGKNLERTHESGLISSVLDNFDKLPIATLKRANGAYVNGHCLWTIGDTTYVYDERAKAWSTWSFKIGGATMFNAGSQVKFTPGDTMYFYKPGGKTVFNYGSSEADSAVGILGGIVMKWKSAPILISPKQKVLNSVGTWVSGTDTTGVSGGIYNELDSSLATLGSFLYVSRATNRYERRSVPKRIPSLYVNLLIQSTSTQRWSVNGFDLWYQDIGETEIK